MKNLLIAFCFGLFSLTAVCAQEKSMNETDYFKAGLQKTEMRKLDPMIGRWAGEGWIQRGANREEFVGTENVQKKLDGLALLVEGRFADKKDTSRVIHETIAVLSYNAKNDFYDFKTNLVNGSGGNFILNDVGKTFEWGMDFPGNKIRYVITIKNGVWNEVGRVSRDEGKTWTHFFEMNLKKL